MIIFRRHRKATMVLAIFGILLLMGCNGNNSGDDPGAGAGDGPTLPPQYSIVPDFGDLVNDGELAAAVQMTDKDLRLSPTADDVCVIDNYLHASGQVGFWNLALTVTLAVPVWSFGEAFHHSPEQQDDGSWLWTYSAHIPTNNGVLHTAKLYGEIIDSRVYWDMYISKEGFYEDYLWYAGESDLFATEGTWTLRKGPNEDVDWIGIEWRRTTADATWEVSYTNIEDGSDEYGGYISYGITTDVDYDAFYDIYMKSALIDNLVEIQADRSSEIGRVRNPDHFDDDEWHYWDSSHCDDNVQ